MNSALYPDRIQTGQMREPLLASHAVSARSPRKFRILHVSSSYPLDERDTTAPFMAELLKAQSDRGHDVAVVVPRVEGLVEGDRAGITVIGARYAPAALQKWGYGRSLGATNRLRPVAVAMTPFALMSTAQLIRRQLRDSDPDVVHIHWILPMGILSRLIPRSIPVVISAHGADSRFFSGVLKPLAAASARRADTIVAASSSILDRVSALAPGLSAKTKVIPHGANSELLTGVRRDYARQVLGIPPDDPIVLGIGRLTPKKGFDILIKAVDLMTDTRTRLYIAGDGAERENLEGLARGNPRIHLVGNTPRPEIALWYAAADVVAIPSIDAAGDIDSGPVVLVEAMAAGRPVVSTRIGMAPALIRDGVNGYLVDELAPESLASALDGAILHSGPLGTAARDTFEELGGWDRVARDLDSIYGELLAK